MDIREEVKETKIKEKRRQEQRTEPRERTGDDLTGESMDSLSFRRQPPQTPCRVDQVEEQ